MMSKRLYETLAMLLIGDSVLALISPTRHVSLWLNGPNWWERMWSPFVQHPRMTRALGLMGLVGGLWLAWRQEAPAPKAERAEQHNGRYWTKRLAEAMQ